MSSLSIELHKSQLLRFISSPKSALILMLVLLVSFNTYSQSYHFKNYSTSEGLTTANTESVVQDAMGFIWVSSESGLSRFDGVEFTHYYSLVGDSTSLMNKSGSEMFVDRSGQLWVSMLQGGVARYIPEDDSFKNYGIASQDGKSVDIGAVVHFCNNSKGDLIIRSRDQFCYKYNESMDLFESYLPWKGLPYALGELYPIFLDSRSRVFLQVREGVLEETQIEIYNQETHKSESVISVTGVVNDVVEDAQGIIWMATWGFGLYRYDPENEHLTNFLPTGEANSFKGRIVEDLELDADDNLWIGTNLGLYRISKASLEQKTHEISFDRPINVRKGSPITEYVKKIECDRKGRIWIATRTNGIFLNENRTSPYSFVKESTTDFTLPALPIFKYEDAQGVQWYAVEDRLLSYNSKSKYYESIALEHNTIPDGAVIPIAEINQAADNRLLISYLGGRAVLLDQETLNQELVKSQSQVPQNVVKTHRDSRGALWVSTLKGLFRYPANETFHFDTILPNFRGAEILEDQQGFIWVGSTIEGLVRVDSQSLEYRRFLPNDRDGSGLLGSDARTLAMAKDGSVCTMTSKGLHVYMADSAKFDFRDPSSNYKLQLTDYFTVDHEGNFWFSSLKGLYFWKAKTQKVMFLDSDAGFPKTSYYDIETSVLGDIYVQTQTGCMRIDPSLISDPVIPEKVIFTTLISENADREQRISLLNTEEVELTYREDYVEIDFAPLNFDLTGKVHFEYMLSSSTSGVWVDIDQETNVSFLDLPHGDYTLKVRGRNDWGEFGPVSEFSLIIEPPWYDSTLALISYGVLLLLTVFGYNRWRTGRLLRRQRELERVVGERTEEIRIEKDRSESLLLNILPEQVAEELKENGEAEAQHMDEVTVLFTDFKGFTEMSEKLSPKDLVKDLNECFSAFDRICEKHGIEKIKTIGDAYMAAGGIPAPKPTHAEDVVKAAFEFRDFIEEGKQRKIDSGLPYFEIRIGVHTGPVVAGIVGVKKFQYDIWGDTVNTASRMESSGEPGEVNISEVTYHLLKDNEEFSFVHRGKIKAKGKGELDMFFVSRSF